MAKHKKAKKTQKQSPADEQRCISLVAQMDTLVSSLCDGCCLANYYTGQRAESIPDGTRSSVQTSDAISD